MIQASTIKFLRELQKNNNKPWFEDHRAAYERAKEDVNELVAQLIPAIASFDPPIGKLQVKECIFRINRDVRFSKDKRPYKNNMASYFNEAGKKGNGAGYYFHIQPGESFAAGGIWAPEAPVLAAIRQEIDYNFVEWKKMLAHKNFRSFFPAGVASQETLVRPPKGYDEFNPAIEYLKMKNFIVSGSFTDKDLQDKDLVKKLAATFKAMKPLIDFINTSMH